MSDYRFERLLGEAFLETFGKQRKKVESTLWDTFESCGHKMGGYAYFTQSDPRFDAPEEETWLLLLQIDSDDDMGIMWGDVGVGGFFIRENDLKKCDFSRVLYNWDCG